MARDYNTTDVRAILGKDADKFIPIFNDIEKGQKPPFVFMAWVLGGIWIFQRKANVTSGVTFMAVISILLLISVISGFGALLYFIWDIIIAKNAAIWYKQRVDAQLASMGK